MSSAAALGPYARVLALSSKSLELRVRGHYERGGDKIREALAVARAVGTEDCLVTAYLTVEEAIRTVMSLLRSISERQAAHLNRLSDADKLRELAEAVAGAASVARRRRIAGTHQPAEQAWYVAYRAADLRTLGCSESDVSASFKRAASICSETTVFAASQLLTVLDAATSLDLFSTSELSSRLESACDLADEAVALAGTLRVNDTSVSAALKAAMETHLRNGVALWRQESSTAAHAERLDKALKQLPACTAV